MTTIIRDSEQFTIVQGDESVTLMHSTGSVRVFAFADEPAPGLGRRAVWRGESRLSLETTSGDALLTEVLSLEGEELRVAVILNWNPKVAPTTLRRIYAKETAPEADDSTDSSWR